MQNVEKGRLLEVATKLYLEEKGFTAYLWHEWASQKGLPLQDTGIEFPSVWTNIPSIEISVYTYLSMPCRGLYSILLLPIRWISEYLAREEDRDTGIVWDPMLRVEEFVDIVKKLVALIQNVG
jgi:hypothetical protein